MDFLGEQIWKQVYELANWELVFLPDQDVSGLLDERCFCADDRLVHHVGGVVITPCKHQADSGTEFFFWLFFCQSSCHLSSRSLLTRVSSGSNASAITRLLSRPPKETVSVCRSRDREAVYFHRYIVDTCTSTEEGRRL